MKTDFIKSIIAASIAAPLLATTHPYIVTGHDMVASSNKSLSTFQVIEKHEDSVIAKVMDSDKAGLSHIAHEENHRCGGYFAFETLDEAKQFVSEFKSNSQDAKKAIFADYTLNQSELVEQSIAQADELSIRGTITKLSSYHNRYYKSQTGIQSQEWLKSHWEEITAHRSDITVEYFNHSSYPQKSVIATIKGKSDEIIVVGGHADSIAGWWGQSGNRAPGADDNASGTATVTETLRVLAQTGYQPEKTIKFMAYAAEEVGLLGSKDIAKTFKRENKNVIGVLQLDMTNFNGSSDDISIINDYTSEAQNTFLTSLIDTYLQNLTWGFSSCGYACSDHASWNSQGYPASIPFEAHKNDMNGHIHTSRDTIEQSGGDASHALKFAKLAIAYVIELDK